MHPLISAADLKDLLASATPPVVLDCSFDLADPAAGERSYNEGHLPQALYVHLDRDLAGPRTGYNGRHPLADRAQYAAWLGRVGVTPETTVVAYDRQGGMYAARVWWVLRWMGHANVALLDGGLNAWQRGGGELTTVVPVPAATPPYPEAAPGVPSIDATALLAQLDQVQVIDARAPGRYRGEVEPLDAVAGHIPGAINRFYQDNLTPDGHFKPADTLRAEFESLLDGRPVVQQCGSGVTACHNLLAMEVAGLGASTLYPGSWSEWSSDAARPMARGPASR